MDDRVYKVSNTIILLFNVDGNITTIIPYDA